MVVKHIWTHDLARHGSFHGALLLATSSFEVEDGALVLSIVPSVPLGCESLLIP